MTTPIPNLADTALLHIQPFDTPHLWVFVSGHTATGSAVMFNFTSWKKNCDETCVIKVGDHPFVTNKTIVEYRRGINLTPIKWQQILENLWYEPKAPVSTELLRRIQQGALAPNSRATQELQEIVKLFFV